MNYKIAEIEGIGEVYAGKLAVVGVKTTGALLKSGAKPAGRKKLAADTGIPEKMILKWCNLADLMRIKGIGKQFSELLEAAGVDTVKELRNRKADNLTAKMKEVNEAKKLARTSPALSLVESWVEAAKTIEPVLSY